MLMKIGMFQQQYQRIESGRDTRISTLLRVLEGMGLELMLVPREQVQYVEKLLSSGDDIKEFFSGETKKMEEPGTSSWSAVLKDLESLQKYMQRLIVNCHDERLESRAFHAQANLLTTSLLSKFPPFLKTIREFHDRSGQA